MTFVHLEASGALANAVDKAVAGLVQTQHWADSSFINLPIVFPDGSFVTVKVDAIRQGYRVSDNGYAYRLLENVGAQRSFGRAAGKIAEAEDLLTNARCIFVDVAEAALGRAICDVGLASWHVVDRVFGRIVDQESEEIEDQLRVRLYRLFPEHFLQGVHSIQGASATKWDVSAVVRHNDETVVFQAVANHPNSVNKAAASFMDMSGLERPPHLVAVVKDMSVLGPKVSLLGQAGGRVIEEADDDDMYRRAAA